MEPEELERLGEKLERLRTERLRNAAPALFYACRAALDEFEGNDCDPEFVPCMTTLRQALDLAIDGVAWRD